MVWYLPAMQAVFVRELRVRGLSRTPFIRVLFVRRIGTLIGVVTGEYCFYVSQFLYNNTTGLLAVSSSGLDSWQGGQLFRASQVRETPGTHLLAGRAAD
jgi:hypothetical protein